MSRVVEDSDSESVQIVGARGGGRLAAEAGSDGEDIESPDEDFAAPLHVQGRTKVQSRPSRGGAASAVAAGEWSERRRLECGPSVASGLSARPTGRKRSRPTSNGSYSFIESGRQLWSDAFAPKSVAELAVHRAKIAEARCRSCASAPRIWDFNVYRAHCRCGRGWSLQRGVARGLGPRDRFSSFFAAPQALASRPWCVYLPKRWN